MIIMTIMTIIKIRVITGEKELWENEYEQEEE